MEKNHISFLQSLFNDNETPRKKVFYSMKAKADAKMTKIEKLANWVTLNLGSANFLLFNLSIFIIWILINTNQIKIIPAFDTFPFIYL